MEDFLSLFDDKSLFKIGFDKGGIGVGDLFIFDGKAALLNEPASLALGGGQASLYQQVQHSDLPSVKSPSVSWVVGMLAVLAPAPNRARAPS